MDRSSTERGLGRRKACDFCCQKKIRCDAKKPQCSGCSLHNVACVWTPGVRSRKSSARLVSSQREQSLIANGNSNADDSRFQSIEDRLKTIEAQLWRNATTTQTPVDEDDEDMAESLDENPATIANTSSRQTSDVDCQGLIPDTPEFTLPSHKEIQPLIENFLDGINQAMPLFSRYDVSKMLEDWYDHPERRTKPIWSALNVLLALSLRHGRDGNTTEGDKLASTYVRNAQSAMDSLVYRDVDLKGLQVVLGLAMFFMTTSHPQPACVLIATAVKLVHRMKLHIFDEKRDTGDPRNKGDHCRLFWITYIIDRDLSLRTHEPYLLQDHDIDRPIHDIASDIGLGRMELYCRREEFDILTYRAKLATIQGKIYDLIYSVRASSSSLKQHQAATVTLDSMLQEWYFSTPEYFRHGDKSMEYGLKRHLIQLHITYSHCRFSVHKASIHNDGWIKRLKRFSESDDGWGFNIEEDPRRLLLPYNWESLATAAQICLYLVRGMHRRDMSLRWNSTCAHEAAITILAANNLTRREHELYDFADKDCHDLNDALSELEIQLEDTQDDFIKSLFESCHELVQLGRVAVNRFRVTDDM